MTVWERVREIQEYARLMKEYGAQGADEQVDMALKALSRIREDILSLPIDEAMRKREPDEYQEILRLRPKDRAGIRARISGEEYREKLMGALLARFVGCTLGAIVENWPIERMEKWARVCGDAFPPKDYWSMAWSPEDPRLYTTPQKANTPSCMDGVPTDDDVTYTLIGLLIAEKYGVNFSTEDVGKAWLELLPVACTAEDIALRNLRAGVPAREAADRDNPYCQWIGGAIRSDPWGYIGAGDPQAAAAMAYRDAYLTHRRNGIYGEMYLAAAQSAAFVCHTAEEALRAGLDEIPAECALSEDIRWALRTAPQVSDWREARRLVDERFAGMSPVHTNNNLCLIVFGLLLGEGDVTKTLGEIVAMGLDNDCTAASAGSIIGALAGGKGIPEHWVKNFRNTAYSYITGYPVFKIDDVANRFSKLHDQLLAAIR